MQEMQEMQERDKRATDRPPIYPSPRRGALFSVAVEGLALRACTLCSPFSGRHSRPSNHPTKKVSVAEGFFVLMRDCGGSSRMKRRWTAREMAV